MHPLTVHSGPCIYYLPVQEQKRPTARDLLQTPRAGVGMMDRGGAMDLNAWENKWGLLCWGLTSACFQNNLVPEREQKTRKGSILFLPTWDRTLQQILQFFSISSTDKTSVEWTFEVVPWPYANQVKSKRSRNHHSSLTETITFSSPGELEEPQICQMPANPCLVVNKLEHEFQVLSKKLNKLNNKQWL